MLTHCGNNVRNRYSGCVFSVKDIVPVPLKTSRNLYRAAKSLIIRESTDIEEMDRYILDRLDSIESTLSSLSRPDIHSFHKNKSPFDTIFLKLHGEFDKVDEFAEWLASCGFRSVSTTFQSKKRSEIAAIIPLNLEISREQLISAAAKREVEISDIHY